MPEVKLKNVVKTFDKGRIIAVDNVNLTVNDKEYLHSDGVIRKATINPETEDFTGHYTTKEHAELVIEIYEKKARFDAFITQEKEENE